MIVVLDSGIWISALQFGGVPLRAVETALALDRIVYCEEIRMEVLQVLTGKLGWHKSRAEASLRIYLQDAIRVLVQGAVLGACRDPTDDMVIECAVNGGANIIVTGDKDLLTIQRHENIRMMTARQYVEQV